MSRSLKKGPFLDQNLMKKIVNQKAGSKEVIKTYARDSTIVPEMVGLTFGVHNGKIFNEVYVTEDMVGHKLGEFSLTRKFVRHGGRMAREEAVQAAEAEKAKVAAAQAATTSEGSKK